jgi:RNA polymerase sigma-32 factor
MARAKSLSPSTFDSGLKRYLDDIRRVPMLDAEEEVMLARRCREHGDRDAAHRLVTSHLRLVAKLASGYRGYGLPVAELISEGSIGLMQAVTRFDPDRGARFATYAIWWIRASIQDYILRSKSLVKLGTTAGQKKLFFNLRRAKSRISALGDGDMHPDQVAIIATGLGVAEQEVIDMNRRLGGDMSLSAPMSEDSEAGSWQDRLIDDAASQEQILAESEEVANGRKALAEALAQLDERERRIFVARRLVERPKRLEELAGELGVSRERVRQIEVRTFEKVRKSVARRAIPTHAPELAAAL